MQNFTFKASGKVISLLEKIIKANIIVEGLENIPPNPCLFVVNHFTRMETFLIPYVLFKHKGMIVHSLASEVLFKGMFGKYLAAMGTVPRREPRRNRMIIHDLITGQANWVIYPEGLMVKNKDVFEKGRYRLNTPLWRGPPHTGAAVLALKAEIARHDCFHWSKEHNNEVVKSHEERYDFDAQNDISSLSTMIVPVNITYYPLRPGKNFLSNIAGLFFKELPKKLEDELKTEGGILLKHSDINIYFGKPIPIAPEIRLGMNIGRKYLPFIPKERRDSIIIDFKRKKLTTEAMKQIYTRTKVHIDHLFCTALRTAKEPQIHRKRFARALYLSAIETGMMEKRRTHPTLERGLIKCVVDEDYSALQSIVALTESVGALRVDGDKYCINKDHITGEDYPFYDIRIKNAAVVIANELEPMNKIVAMVERNINAPEEILQKRIAETLHEWNQLQYERDYEKYYDPELSKERKLGSPIYLPNKDKTTGIVLAHGYLAPPEEMRPLAEYLHSIGYSVYVPCLRGMGTAPNQLKDVTFDDWIYSFDKAYAIIRNSCKNVYVGGFSAGGLLALIAAARKKNAIRGVFCINTPIVLHDIKSSFAPGVVTWNELVEKIHLGELKLEYIESQSESPDINYSRNYTKGVMELKLLINACRKSLFEITAPLLAIQGTGDPVVKPESAKIIYDHASSEIKEIKMMDSSNHIIIRSEGREKVFQEIERFLLKQENS
ncbi:hypothetical protein BVX94_01455 [bacterium B17]|nr:hypothetical protein BVX94_01455 [bacterium B17]